MGQRTLDCPLNSVCAGDPQNLLVDATGHYLYATDAVSDYIAAFAINQTNGALTTLPGSPYC